MNERTNSGDIGNPERKDLGSGASGEAQGLEVAMDRNRPNPGHQIRTLEPKLELVTITLCIRGWVVQWLGMQAGTKVRVLSQLLLFTAV